MAIVLGAVGLFLYLKLESDLNESIDQGLRSRSSQLVGLVKSAQGEKQDIQQALTGAGESFAQVLTTDGRVRGTSPQLSGGSVLSASERRAVRAGQEFLDPRHVRGVDGQARLLAISVNTTRQRLITVVGTPLDDRDDALGSLATLLLIGGPVALLLASLAAYLATAAALRPVEALRRGAAGISMAQSGRRLPVPPAADELRRLAETLNRMLSRLEAAVERERRFVDEASHELRTPLALQRTELELALRYEDDPERLRSAIASAIDEVDRLIELAEDLLVLGRSESGEVAADAAPLELSPVLASIHERFANRARSLGRPLVVDEADGLTVNADAALLERALTNLVENAFSHGAGEVRVWTLSADGRVEVHVADGGPGFPRDFIDSAFERFSRADSARPRDGTGLGLAIVEAVAEAHRGAVHAENRADGGAHVWIELPLGRSEAEYPSPA